MHKKIRLALVMALLLTLIGSAALAQPARGSIRGTVREDQDGDGKCANGAPIHGMPLQFRSTHADRVTVYLQSGSNGTYGLVAAGFGTWDVTAMPNADFRITSKKTISVFIDQNQSLALGVDFCAQKTRGTAGSGSGGKVILPQSGGAATSPDVELVLLLVFALGATLALSGTALEYRRRSF